LKPICGFKLQKNQELFALSFFLDSRSDFDGFLALIKTTSRASAMRPQGLAALRASVQFGLFQGKMGSSHPDRASRPSLWRYWHTLLNYQLTINNWQLSLVIFKE
jgi:hypothetical protein